MHEPTVRLGKTGILDLDLEKDFPQFFATPLQSLAENGVTLTGRRSLSDMYSEIKSASVAVVNCNWRGSVETYCRSAVEAQMAGVPVVGAASGSLREAIRDGVSGLLAHSVEELESSICRLLLDTSFAESLSKAGPAHVSRLADYDQVAETWTAIFDRINRRVLPPITRDPLPDLLRAAGASRIRELGSVLVRKGRYLKRRITAFSKSAICE
jgi:glycosyltransferase involved in cell wall biosynthesis